MHLNYGFPFLFCTLGKTLDYVYKRQELKALDLQFIHITKVLVILTSNSK